MPSLRLLVVIVGLLLRGGALGQGEVPALAALSLGTPEALAPPASAAAAAPPAKYGAAMPASAKHTASLLDETRQRTSNFKNDASDDVIRRIREATLILEKRNAELVAAKAKRL